MIVVASEQHRTVAVHVEQVATDRGLWCARCLLPSAVGLWVAVVLGDRMHLQRRLWCRDCDSGAHVIDHVR